MSTFASRSVLAVALAALLVFSLSSPVLAGDDSKKIRALGNPLTAYSTERAETVDSLRSQLKTHRSEIEQVLRDAGWSGNPDDLYSALMDSEPTRVVLPTGSEMDWMVFRKNGDAVITNDLVWDPKWAPAGQEQVFDAWQINVESNCETYIFVVPVACVNLALYKASPDEIAAAKKTIDAMKAPSCELTATAGTAACDEYAEIKISGNSSDGSKLEITNVAGGNMSGLSSSGNNAWTYTPSAAGSYTFTGTATAACGRTAECKSQPVKVAEVDPCVKCNIKVTYDEETRTVTVADNGSVGTLDITGFTLPDGTAGDMSQLTAGGNRWTYTHKKYRKPGSYTWTFDATAERNGKTADCDAAVTLDVPEPDYAWIFRGVGLRVDADDSASSSTFLPSGANQRDHFQAESGNGIGLSLERIFSPRLGLEFGVMFASFDSTFMRDIDEAWEMQDQDVDMTAITIGPNFHLTPNSSVDFYIGPFVSFVQLDDATYNLFGQTFRAGDEDEFTFGAQLGLDVPTSSTWAFTAGIKYLALDLDIEEGAAELDELDLGIDPLIFSVGVAYRF